MFRTAATLFLTFTFSLLSLQASAADQKMDRLFELSGLTDQLTMMPEMIASTVAQGEQRVPADKVAKAEEIFRKAFASDRLKRQLHDEVDGAFTAAEVDRMLAWYSSPLAIKITASEKAAAMVDGVELQMAVAGLEDNQRLFEIAQEVEKLTGVTDMMMRFQEQAALSLYTSVAAIARPSAPLNYDQMQEAIRQQMGAAREQTYGYMIAVMVYSWKDIPLADLEKYADFLRTPEAVRFMRLSTKGILDGMNLAFSDGISELMQLMKAEFEAGAEK